MLVEAAAELDADAAAAAARGFEQARLEPDVVVAAKWVNDDTDGFATGMSAHWVHGRTSWTLGRHYDVGLKASLLEASGSRRGGVGVELGRRLDEHVWLSLGYNHLGYSDDELTGEEYTRQGVALRVRAKFDETLFGVGAEPAGGRP